MPYSVKSRHSFHGVFPLVFLDTRSDENRDKWGAEGTPYVLVCTREVSENGCRMYILCSDGQSDNTEIGVIDKMIEFDVASSSGDYLQPIVWTCHAEQVGDEESALFGSDSSCAAKISSGVSSPMMLITEIALGSSVIVGSFSLNCEFFQL